MSEKMSLPLPLAPPESFFVFVVGHCEEWPENREEQGDTAIYKEYLDFGVPKDQCVYLKDNECTRKNCQARLEAFLTNIDKLVQKKRKKKVPTTFVFYYGGHGAARGFSTIGGTWLHKQIVETIENCFHGDRVLFLLDCCSAGSLWRHLSTARNYALLGTSRPYLESSSYLDIGPAGEEWIISNTWIQIMRRFRDLKSGDYLGLEQTISILADRHVLELGETFFAYLTPKAKTLGWSWMPEWNGTEKSMQPAPLLPWLPEGIESKSVIEPNQIPQAAKILSVFDCRVGDALAYKHLGGHPVSLGSKEHLPFYVPPLWLTGTIVSIFQNENCQTNEETHNKNNVYNSFLRIRVWYPSQTEPWEVELSHCSPRLINHFHVAQNWMLPRSFLETQVVLAKKYRQYLDCSLAANTSVRVAVKDDEVLEGMVMDWKEFDWKRLLHSCTGMFPAMTDYDDFHWNELPVPIKAAANVLGYKRSSWDNDTGIPVDSMNWEDLSKDQKDAAKVLGYTQPKSVRDSSDSDGIGSSKSLELLGGNIPEISASSGPHIPVEWQVSQQPSLVPLKQIVHTKTYKNNGKIRKNCDATTILNSASPKDTTDDEDGNRDLQHQSLLQGLQSSGKSIRNAEHIFATTELSAFWVGNETWYEAVPINIEYHDSTIRWSDGKNKGLSLDLLATHFEYTLPGIYCPIEYEDGERHLIPLKYIYRRGCQPQQVEEDDSDSDSTTKMTLARALCSFCERRKSKE